MLKKCVECGDEFHAKTRRSTCGQDCWNKHSIRKAKEQKKRHYQENREVYIERASKRYWADPAAKAAYDREYNKKNRERINTRERNRYASQPEKYLARNRISAMRRKNANPIKFKENAVFVQAKTRSQYKDPIDRKVWYAKRKAQGVCQACGTDKRLEIDHIVDLVRGGNNHIDNLQLLCKKCNIRKCRSIFIYDVREFVSCPQNPNFSTTTLKVS